MTHVMHWVSIEGFNFFKKMMRERLGFNELRLEDDIGEDRHVVWFTGDITRYEFRVHPKLANKTKPHEICEYQISGIFVNWTKSKVEKIKRDLSADSLLLDSPPGTIRFRLLPGIWFISTNEKKSFYEYLNSLYE